MSERRILIAPSVLACDFAHLADEIQKVEVAGADWLHVDVMDGHFVPNLTIGPVVVEAIRRCSRLPLDVHLMLDHPERYVKPFVDAGAQYLTVHVEAPGVQTEGALLKTLKSIRQAGAQAGLSLRPRTSAEASKPFIEAVDLLLVMTVEPGFGGQAFMSDVVPKIRQLRQWFTGDLSVDGGIDAHTGRQCREAGANVFVAGTYIFRQSDYRAAISALRSGSC